MKEPRQPASAEEGRAKLRIIDVRPAGPNEQVVTALGGRFTYRREPCSGCPWRCDQDGQFPAEAFRLSARTAYDMSTHHFSCHESGVEKPAVCAGYLLNGSHDNLGARLARIRGDLRDDVTDGGHVLHESYRAMAVANGVGADEEVLRPCRG